MACCQVLEALALSRFGAFSYEHRGGLKNLSDVIDAIEQVLSIHHALKWMFLVGNYHSLDTFHSVSVWVFKAQLNIKLETHELRCWVGVVGNSSRYRDIHFPQTIDIALSRKADRVETPLHPFLFLLLFRLIDKFITLVMEVTTFSFCVFNSHFNDVMTSVLWKPADARRSNDKIMKQNFHRARCMSWSDVGRAWEASHVVVAGVQQRLKSDNVSEEADEAIIISAPLLIVNYL